MTARLIAGPTSKGKAITGDQAQTAKLFDPYLRIGRRLHENKDQRATMSKNGEFLMYGAPYVKESRIR